MKYVLCVVGTRPEAIKMAPVILKLKNSKNIKCILALTGQHTDMVTSVLKDFDIKADINLNIQSQTKVVEDVLLLSVKGITDILRSFRFDYVFVHGDTSSTLAGALAGMYAQVPVAHVEAGLRSFDVKNPWPEEYNRKAVGSLCELHFAPTERAVHNLLNEGVPREHIIMTGNTVVDALHLAMNKIETSHLKNQIEDKFSKLINFNKKVILFTGHRRENLGQGLNNIFKALVQLSQRENIEIIFPIHPNPKVRESIQEYLNDNSRIKLIEPLNYLEMIWMLSKIDLLITDSGGLQEEAASFDLPVLVTRVATERTEAIDTGQALLVGSDTDLIVNKALLQLNKLKQVDVNQTKVLNPFGDGFASDRILKVVESGRTQLTPLKSNIVAMM